jgi:rhamnosyltransferase subunit B
VIWRAGDTYDSSPPPMARIVFTALGSLGDLHPLLPLAQRLRTSGHEVSFAVPTHLAAIVAGEGFECHPIATRAFAPSPQSADPAAVRARIAERLPDILASTTEVLGRVCAKADLIVTHPHQLAAAMAARKLRIRWATVTVYPGLIPSSYTVPEPHWIPALPTPAGRVVNALTWKVFSFGLRHLSRDIIEESLAAQGLQADDVFMPGGLSPYLTLVLSSPAYSPAQPDWPATVKLTGYVTWDQPRGWQNPQGLSEFLDSGDPPVIVTTSSAGERDAASFFKSALSTLELTQQRGVLLLGAAAGQFPTGPGDELAPGVRAWPYLPLSLVLPRSSLVVHHGGVSTTLTTIRHGRPAVAVPAMFDQWYNAKRIASLEIGRVVEWKRLTAERLADAIQAVLANPSYRRRAEELGAVLALEDGPGQAAEAIGRLLAS